MANCDNIPTLETVQNFNKDAKVLTEVVTSDALATSQVDSKGNTHETLTYLNQLFGGINVGDYVNGTVLNKVWEYAYYATTGVGYKIVSKSSLPYPIDATTYPDPEDDPNLKRVSDADKAYVDSEIADLQSQIDSNDVEIADLQSQIDSNDVEIADLKIDNNRTSTLTDKKPVIDLKPETLGHSDAFGGAFVSDGGEFLRGKLPVSSVTGLVGLDDDGYYVTLDSSQQDAIKYQADRMNDNDSFTFMTKLSHQDLTNPTYEPFIFAHEPSGSYTDTARFGLVMGSTLQLWDSHTTTFRDIFDYDFRDGNPHEFILSFNSKNCQILVAVDGMIVFNRQLNASLFRLQCLSDWITFGGYANAGAGDPQPRQINGRLYSAKVWNYFTTDIASLRNDGVISVQSKRFSPNTLPAPEYIVKPGGVESYRSYEFIDMYIILGQSNASGRGLVSDVKSSPVAAGQFSQFEFLDWTLYNQFIAQNNANQHQVIEFGVNQAFGSDNVDSTTFGFETSIGLAEFNRGNKCLHVRRSQGATSLYVDWNPNGGSEGSLYLQAISDIEDAFDAAIAAGYIPIVKGLVWMQGERDAKGDLGVNPSTYYQAYLETLINNVRSTCSSKVSSLSTYASVINGGCRVIIPDIKIGPTQVASYPDWEDINTYHLSAAQSISNAITINTAFLPQDDDLHFNAYGLMALGESIVNTVNRKRKYI